MNIPLSSASMIGGSILRIPPFSLRKAQDFLPSYANLLVNVMIRAIPKYCLILANENQDCSLLSTSTSVSLSLNCSDLLLLGAFNKESWDDISFIEASS